MKTRVLILSGNKNLEQAISQSAEFEVRSEQTKRGLLGVFPWLKFLAAYQTKETLELLREYQPAIVLACDPVSVAVMTCIKSKGLYIGKIVVPLGGYYLDQRLVFREIDLYMCKSVEQASALSALEIEQDKIVLVQSLVEESFYQEIDREVACRETGMLTTMPTVLVIKGEANVQETKELFVNFLRSPKTYQIAVLCGTEDLKKELSEISAPARHPAKFFASDEMLQPLMSAGKVAVSESVGFVPLATAKKLPVILSNIHGAQSTSDLNYFVKNRVVEYGRIPREAVFLAEQVLEGRGQKNWSDIQSKILKPANSSTILQALDRVKPPTPPVPVKNYQSQ